MTGKDYLKKILIYVKVGVRFDTRLNSLTRTDDGLLYDTFYNKYNGGAWNSNLTRLGNHIVHYFN